MSRAARKRRVSSTAPIMNRYLDTAAYPFSASDKRLLNSEQSMDCLYVGGAGGGNRTPMTSLEGWSSTIELRPPTPWYWHLAANKRGNVFENGGKNQGHYGH